MRNIILFLLFMISSVVNGQIKSNTSIGGNYSQGNSGILLVSLQSSIQSDSTKVQFNISPYFCYSQVKSNDSWSPKQRESFLTTSVLLKRNKINLYLFSELENSLDKKINFRGSVGIGVGKYFDTKILHISTSIGLMPEYYQTLSNEIEKTLRLSLRCHLETKGNVKFKTITLVQPAILMTPMVGNNFNLRSTNSISVLINKNAYGKKKSLIQ